MPSLKLGIVGDGGTNRLWSTRFYYSPGAGYLNGKGVELKDGKIANVNVTSSGPMQDAVVRMVLSKRPDHILNLGDMVYNTGSSTLYEDNVGRQFNHFMAPYPSPNYTNPKGPYRRATGNKVWPYDTYNYPNGYPNPLTGKKGGSRDGVNRFWPTIGNHEYYLRTSSQGEANISLHTSYDEGASTVPDGNIKGQTRTPAPQPYIDYFAWLKNPSLAKQSGLSVGLADITGNSGVYYKVSLGTNDTSNRGSRLNTNKSPLVDVFSIDSMRLIMNRGGKYPQFTDGLGPDDKARSITTWNLEYDPTLKPTPGNRDKTEAVNSTDKYNGWKQFNWLKNELAKSKARWKIIMGHQPIYGSGDSNGQLDDNVNNPELQRLLKGLPKGSFDAYINGHAHFYQRSLENNNNGIGQGIPFIGLGSSGRLLDGANPIKYGQSTYNPTFPNDIAGNDNFMGKESSKLKGSKYYTTGFAPYLLPSDPISVAISAGRKVNEGWQTDYGFGFGGGFITATDNSLNYSYEQPEVVDPAIADNLKASTRLKALKGWAKLSKADWQPKDPVTGEVSSSLSNTAMLRLTFEPADNGQVAAVSVHNPGSGYMSKMRGDHSVDFEIRGNDQITGSRLNPNDAAIIRLKFNNGSLIKASIVNDGSGYENLGQVMQSYRGFTTVPFTENRDALVPLNYSLVDTWYEAPNSNYKDSYLIAKTRARTRVINGQSGRLLEVKVVGKDKQTEELLNKISQPSHWTTGYSGFDKQRGYSSAQQGSITVKDKTGLQIGKADLTEGVAHIPMTSLPTDQKLEVLFGGDAVSSYLVNFKPSSTFIDL